MADGTQPAAGRHLRTPSRPLPEVTQVAVLSMLASREVRHETQFHLARRADHDVALAAIADLRICLKARLPTLDAVNVANRATVRPYDLAPSRVVPHAVGFLANIQR